MHSSDYAKYLFLWAVQLSLPHPMYWREFAPELVSAPNMKNAANLCSYIDDNEEEDCDDDDVVSNILKPSLKDEQFLRVSIAEPEYFESFRKEQAALWQRLQVNPS